MRENKTEKGLPEELDKGRSGSKNPKIELIDTAVLNDISQELEKRADSEEKNLETKENASPEAEEKKEASINTAVLNDISKELEKSLNGIAGKDGEPEEPVKESGEKAEKEPVEEAPDGMVEISAEEPEKEDGKPEDGSNKKGKGFKIAIIVLVVIAAAVALYMVKAYGYTDKFFSGTRINGVDVGGMTVAEAEEKLQAGIEDYQLELKFRDGRTETLTAEAIGYAPADSNGVQSIKDSQTPALWIQSLFGSEDKETAIEAQYDESMLQSALFALPELDDSQMAAPTDAYVTYDGSSYVVMPETQGNTIDKTDLLSAVEGAVSAGQTSIDVESLGVYAAPTVLQNDPNLAQQAEVLNNYVAGSITYELPDGSTVVLDGSTLAGWLSQDEQGNYYKDDEVWNQHIAEFVASLAARVDTDNGTIPFETTGLGTVDVTNYALGYQIDQEGEIAQLAQELESNAVVTREPLYNRKSATTENYGIGYTYVEIDLSRQHMWVYENGSLWMETDIVSRKMTHTRYTPEGAYKLYNKETARYLRGPRQADGSFQWNAYVDYWMPFNEAIGMHDAQWQYSFGGDNYLYGGSQGCINMPFDKASQLYGWITIGTPVICYYSEPMQFID